MKKYRRGERGQRRGRASHTSCCAAKRLNGHCLKTAHSFRKRIHVVLSSSLEMRMLQNQKLSTMATYAQTPGEAAAPDIYLYPGAFPGTPPPLRSLHMCSSTFSLAAVESPTSEGLQTKRFWSLAEEKLAGFQCSWQTLGGLHFSICRREQKCVCLHRLMAPPLRRPPPPAHRHYWRGWALEGVRLPVRSECKCYVIHYQM